MVTLFEAMKQHASDKLLVRRLLAQDESAFKEFFELYFERLHRFSKTRLGGDREATKDVTQTTLIRAIRKLHTYRGEAALFTWLCTLCRHEISDFLAKESKFNQRFMLVEDLEETRGALESIDSLESDPEKFANRNQRARIIQVALDQLPKHYGDALEWKYIYGHSTADIATKMSLGKEATQSLLARARRAFHDVYSTLISSLPNVPNQGLSKTL